MTWISNDTSVITLPKYSRYPPSRDLYRALDAPVIVLFYCHGSTQVAIITDNS